MQNRNEKWDGSNKNMEKDVEGDVAARAPYNFVPFSNTIIERYTSTEIGTEGAPPAHDEITSELHSGSITVSLEAVTPILVSEGSDGKTNEKHFYKNANGQYAIPGASFRGLIRENVQILGFGHVTEQDVYDRQLFFRVVGAAKNSVGSDLGSVYKTILGVKSEQVGTKIVNGKKKPAMVSKAQKVKAGYLHCVGKEYYIMPTRGNRYFTADRAETFATMGKMQECVQNCRFVVLDINKNQARVLGPSETATGAHNGVLVVSGKPINETNVVYVFPEENKTGGKIDVNGKAIAAYLQDYEVREKQLVNPEYWALPKSGDSKPVFYTTLEDGTVIFGMTQFLRIPYKNSLGKGLPLNHLLLREKKDVVLDYVHALFGYSTDAHSYAARVSFGDLVNEQAKELTPFPVIPGEPKPSFYEAYSVGGRHYNDEFSLRGYKQYWQKPFRDKPSVGKDKEKVTSMLAPLQAGTTFRGTIQFRNLTDDELGLLLWAIVLEPGCTQSIGMGKPLGLGCVNVRIEKLEEYRPEELYCGFLAVNSSGAPVKEYIRAGKAYISARLGSDVMKEESIDDFFFIHHMQEKIPSTYLNLDNKDYQNLRDVLPTIDDYKRDYPLKSSAEPVRPIPFGQSGKPYGAVPGKNSATPGKAGGVETGKFYGTVPEKNSAILGRACEAKAWKTNGAAHGKPGGAASGNAQDNKRKLDLLRDRLTAYLKKEGGTKTWREVQSFFMRNEPELINKQLLGLRKNDKIYHVLEKCYPQCFRTKNDGEPSITLINE